MSDVQTDINGMNGDELIEVLHPYEDDVVGHDIADLIHKLLESHVKLNKLDYIIATLWIILTYVYDYFGICPKLYISSPEKRCGKSTLMEVLHGLVYQGLIASNITPSAIFRIVEIYKPTLLLDEADTYMRDSEKMRGIVNSGHKKSSAYIYLTDQSRAGNHPRRFSTWSPMAIAGIGKQAGTIMDRSIRINMKRKLSSEKLDRIGFDFYERNQSLRSMLLRWAIDNKGALKAVNLEMPHCNNDRASDNWFPLFVIAHAIGGYWYMSVKDAFNAATLEGSDDEHIGTMLLRDICEIYGDQYDRLHSRDLVEKLNDLESRPWCELKHGKPMTAISLAKLVEPYGVKSKQLRISGTNRHGYELSQFMDAFKHYLTPAGGNQNATTLQASNGKGCSEIKNAIPDNDVAFQNRLKASNGKGCSVVAVQNPYPTLEHTDEGEL